MALFELRVTLDHACVNELVARLIANGIGGVEERALGKRTLLVLYAPSRREAEAIARMTEAELARLAERRPLARAAEVELGESTAGDWETEWTRWLAPEPITPRIVLQPASDSRPAPRGKRRLLFEPDLVFGVGSHPTTRLAARAVERHCRARPGANVLDVGTGTGVLAMVAALSGAARVRGLDSDPRAVRSARKNAAQNALDARCSFSRRALASERGRFDLVVANVELPALEALAFDLARVTAADGRLLVTGLLAERVPELAQRFATLGLRLRAKRAQGEWALLELGWAKPRKVATKATPHDRGREREAGRRRRRGRGRRRRRGRRAGARGRRE